MAASHPLSFRQNLWVYLSLFLVSNALISYSGLSMTILCWVGLLGILLPLYVAFRTSRSDNEKPLYLTDLKLSIPTWLLTVAIVGTIFLRFYKLETFPCWPNLDEGWIGTLAIELSRHWTWKFFYTFGETPPLSIWCPALLFKLGCSPAFSLWFPPAVVSLLTVFVAYFSARQYCSKSFALVTTGLMAFSFWPLYIGRVCHQGIWLPLWVCLVLFLWGRFQKAKGDKARRNWAVGLGLGLGFGSFTFTPWMPVAAVFILSFAWKMSGDKKKDWRNFSYFGLAFLISLAPFILAVFREGYGHHIASLSPWGGWFKEFTFFTSFFKYFAVLFWGAYEKDPAYTPIWGGFLNPLLGAFFFAGVIEMFQHRRQKIVQWITAAFLLFFLPGALSPNLETFRVAQVLPLVFFVTALGIYSLLAKIPEPKQTFAFVLLLSFTATFDFNLLVEPYRNPNAHPENFGRPLKSLERYRTYMILNNLQKEKGPGLFLTRFDTDSFNDPTLSVMTNNFNSAENDALLNKTSGPTHGLGWLALFVNIHYEPFLEKRFPEAKWFTVSNGLRSEDGGNMLGLFSFPLHQDMTPLFAWYAPYPYFCRADRYRFLQNNKLGFDLVLWTFNHADSMLGNDPFLESVYWDKRAAYEYEALNYEEQLRSYQMAVTRGYPTADLYYKMGQLYLVKQHYAEAKEAFLKATQAPLDLTPAKAMLEWLKTQPAASQFFK